MEPPEFPPNSEVSKKTQDKNIEPVTSGSARRRKKSLRKQFSESIVAGDMKSVTRFVMLDVLLPQVKDMIVEVVHSGVEKLIFGDNRRSRFRGLTPPQSGPTGYVSYNRYSGPMRDETRLSSASRVLSRQARSQHEFDEIVLDSRIEAEEVIDRLFDLVSRYESATVADLYELVGLPSAHTDHKWGWTDFRGSGVSRIRDGYILDLPDPEPLD
jgi:hypothetical protein